MNSNQVQDIRLMYEAVYNDELREKADEYNYSVYDEDIVEVATEYFYTYGLNESGIDILIEKVGLDNFVDFVYSLSEELVVDLEEAKRSKAKKQPSMLASQKAKLAAQRAAKERTETERKEPESKGADTEAKAEQPKSRKPEKGGIGRAISGAIERAKKDIELTKKTAGTIAKAYKVGVEGLNTASDSRLARQARVATHKGVKRHTQALKDIGGTLGRTLGASTARRMTQEEDFEYILDYLISEGYADTDEDAFAIMCDMNLDDIDSIIMERRREDRDIPRSKRDPVGEIIRKNPEFRPGMASKRSRDNGRTLGQHDRERGVKKTPGKKPPVAGDFKSGAMSPKEKVEWRRKMRQDPFPGDVYSQGPFGTRGYRSGD